MKNVLKSACGIDVHSKMLMATIVYEEKVNKKKVTKEFPNFNSKFKDLINWLTQFNVEKIVLESTSVYWMQIYDHLSEAGFKVELVNAYHVKKVPGRKTDVSDSEWLAELCLHGLLRASFVPSSNIRSLRLLTRYRIKVSRQLASEKNRLGKVLDSCGMRLSAVMSRIDCVSGIKMVKALAEGNLSENQIVSLAQGSLKKKEKNLKMALSGELTDRHRFLLSKILNHMEFLNGQLDDLDKKIFSSLGPYKKKMEITSNNSRN